MNTQRTKRKARVSKGLCAYCGEPRNRYAYSCDDCARKQRAWVRRLVGAKPWERGSAGRPPIVE